VSSKVVAIVLLLQTFCSCLVCAELKSIEGTYRNPALGYSVKVPRGLKGVTGDQAGPERGIGISLPSGGKIVVFGEPNSAEYKTPQEGVGAELNLGGCDLGKREIKTAPVGKLRGAKGSLACDGRVVLLFLAFRTHGGPIYWLRLDTLRQHASEDEATLNAIAASFRLIRWE